MFDSCSRKPTERKGTAPHNPAMISSSNILSQSIFPISITTSLGWVDYNNF